MVGWSFSIRMRMVGAISADALPPRIPRGARRSRICARPIHRGGRGPGQLGADAPGGKQQVVDIAGGQLVANADFGHIPAQTIANRRPTFVSSAAHGFRGNELYRYDIQASDP